MNLHFLNLDCSIPGSLLLCNPFPSPFCLLHTLHYAALYDKRHLAESVALAVEGLSAVQEQETQVSKQFVSGWGKMRLEVGCGNFIFVFGYFLFLFGRIFIFIW